jgi:uridine kinase
VETVDEEMINGEMEMRVPPVRVVIAGASGSGKSTLAACLADRLEDLDPVVLRQDDYFRGFREFDDAERERVRTANHPDAILWDEFHAALDRLSSGAEVAQPAPGSRAWGRPARTLGPAGLIIVEGLFALWDERCRSGADLRIFTEVGEDEGVLRRLQRDIAERGATLDRAIAWYRRDVAPNYPVYTAPTREHADVVVPTNHPIEVAVVTLCDAIRGIAGRREIEAPESDASREPA